MKSIDDKIKALDEVTAVATTPGNALADEYMRGMANGLILAQSIFHDKEPEYITAQVLTTDERTKLTTDADLVRTLGMADPNKNVPKVDVVDDGKLYVQRMGRLPRTVRTFADIDADQGLRVTDHSKDEDKP